jgi:hypothetical protein
MTAFGIFCEVPILRYQTFLFRYARITLPFGGYLNSTTVPFYVQRYNAEVNAFTVASGSGDVINEDPGLPSICSFDS